MLLHNLIWEGMTPEHRRAYLSLKYGHYHRWIMAAHGIGTASHQASSPAHAFAVATWPDSRCFICGKTERWEVGGVPKE